MVNNLKDIRIFNKFIRYYLGDKRTKKKFKFYKLLSKAHQYHKDEVEAIIRNMHKFGYWKDYMFLLLASKRKYHKVHQFTYNFLYEKLLEDVDRYENKEEISTLAKWMPRQNSSFDKKLKFVTKFSKMLFPNDSNANYRKMRYRKLISKLCDKINIVERQITKKDYKNIQFTQLPYFAFKKNYKIFISKEELIPKVEGHIYRYYVNLNKDDFMNKLYRSHEHYDDIHKKAVMRAYDMNKHKYYSDLIKSLHVKPNEKVDLLVRLDKEVFNDNKIIGFLSIMTLLSEYHDINIIVATKRPYILYLDGDIFNMLEQIKMATCSYTNNAKGIKKLRKNKQLLKLDIKGNLLFRDNNKIIVKKHEKIPKNKELLDEVLKEPPSYAYYVVLFIFAVITLIYICISQ